jgi:hypothetical protein
MDDDWYADEEEIQTWHDIESFQFPSEIQISKDEETTDSRYKYIYENEDAISIDLQCNFICLQPLEDPVQHECGHMFCKLCIAKVSTCPVCRVDLNEEPVRPVKIKVILNALNDLMVICPICASKIRREHLLGHIGRCPVRKYLILIYSNLFKFIQNLFELLNLFKIDSNLFIIQSLPTWV